MENGRKLGPDDERGAARPRRSKRAADLRGDGGEGDLEPLLVGHCRQAVTLLPRGVLGVTTAIEFLEALPAAHRLGLPDVTHSGPKLFALLVAHGVLGQDHLWRVLRAHAEFVAQQVVRLESGTIAFEEEAPGRLKAEPGVFGASTGAEVFVELLRRVVEPSAAMDAHDCPCLLQPGEIAAQGGG